MTKPLYEQLVDELSDKINRREIGPGQRIPTDGELCKQYNISSITVRRAMRELSRQGLIVRRPRLGTFAADDVCDGSVRGAGRRLRSLLFAGIFLNDELESHAVHGLSVAAEGRGVRLMVQTSLNDPDREADLLESLSTLSADGAVILPVIEAVNLERYVRLKFRGLPFVLLDRYFDGLDVPHVVTDDVAAGYQLTKRLYDRGHRRIAFIGEDLSVMSIRRRYEGYLRALHELRIVANPTFVRLIAPYVDPGGRPRNIEPEKHGYRQLLSLPQRPTAVVAANNYHARRLISVATEMGLVVPRELSVAGIGGPQTARQCHPVLEFMRQDFERMGREAFEVLRILVEEGRIEHREIPTEPIAGGSVAPPDENGGTS